MCSQCKLCPNHITCRNWCSCNWSFSFSICWSARSRLALRLSLIFSAFLWTLSAANKKLKNLNVDLKKQSHTKNNNFCKSRNTAFKYALFMIQWWPFHLWLTETKINPLTWRPTQNTFYSQYTYRHLTVFEIIRM